MDHDQVIENLKNRILSAASCLNLPINLEIENEDGEIEDTTIDVSGTDLGIVISYDEREVSQSIQLMIPQFAAYSAVDEELLNDPGVMDQAVIDLMMALTVQKLDEHLSRK